MEAGSTMNWCFLPVILCSVFDVSASFSAHVIVDRSLSNSLDILLFEMDEDGRCHSTTESLLCLRERTHSIGQAIVQHTQVERERSATALQLVTRQMTSMVPFEHDRDTWSREKKFNSLLHQAIEIRFWRSDEQMNEGEEKNEAKKNRIWRTSSMTVIKRINEIKIDNIGENEATRLIDRFFLLVVFLFSKWNWCNQLIRQIRDLVVYERGWWCRRRVSRSCFLRLRVLSATDCMS